MKKTIKEMTAILRHAGFVYDLSSKTASQKRAFLADRIEKHGLSNLSIRSSNWW